MNKKIYIAGSIILLIGILSFSNFFSESSLNKNNQTATVIDAVLDTVDAAVDYVAGLFSNDCTSQEIPEGSTVDINDIDNTITINVPYITSGSKCFAPTFETFYSKAVVTPTSGETVDFTNPVTYTVDQDGFIKEYVVTVNMDEPVYNITTCDELQKIKYNPTEAYTLANDIDCSQLGFSPIGDSSTPFTGSFNGNGYTISNLYINRPTEANVGLFGYANNTNISNLKLVNANIAGGVNIGSILGSGSGNITDVSVTSTNIKATSSNSYMGGISGNFSGSIKNTSFEGSVTLTGDKTCTSSQGQIYTCSQSGKVGGLIGTSNSSIDNSSFIGNITSDAPYTGGLVGTNSGAINNSYVKGVVSGGAYFYRLNGGTGNTDGYGYTGGLMGQWGGSLSNSYFVGDVYWKDLPSSYYYSYCAGGLVGDGWGATINSSFASTNFKCIGQCNGNQEVGGLGGCGRYVVMKDSAVYYTGPSVKPFAYGNYTVQAINSFVVSSNHFFTPVGLPIKTWDKNIWGINPSVNNNYPYLKSFNTQLEPKINFFVISGISGIIDQGAGTIEVKVPLLTSEMKNTTPDITFDGVSISPEIGVAQDFTNPVVYTVTGSDGKTREYTVSITNTINNISSCTDLQNIKNNTSLRYVITNNIDCSGVNFAPISTFSGELYGEGYTIDNLSINRPTESNIGLFTNITGKVSNLGITNASIVGLTNVGILSAVSEGNIEKVYTTGSANSISEISNENVWIPRESKRSWKDVTSSADGTKLAAVVSNGQIYTSVDSGVTWTPRESNRSWYSITSSADGTKLAAVVSNGKIYTSTNSGVTWTPRESNRSWYSITSSVDGTKLAAVVWGGKIYTSSDSGVTWTPRESNRSWYSITSSADGTKLAAVLGGVVNTGQIYTSVDSGVTWTPRESNRNWRNITSSADGTKLAAVVSGGQIYTSTDSGITWIPRQSNFAWTDITSSADGAKLVVVTNGGQIYTSTDSGVTWTPRESVRSWSSVASSFDGSKFVAVSDKIYTTQLNSSIGGLIGQQNSGKITDSYSQANVTGYDAGGLVGKQINTGTIVNSYSTGNITSVGTKGGLISASVSVTNSYWDINTSGQTTSVGGAGKTTAQMKTQSTYSGWDPNIWNLVDGAYPTFKVLVPVSVTCTSFTYSDWSTCTNSIQTRNVSTSLPSGCTGGNPFISQSCVVTPVVDVSVGLGASPISILEGKTTNISWTPIGAKTCTAFGGDSAWPGSLNVADGEHVWTTGALAINSATTTTKYIYGVTCSNDNKTIIATTTVTVIPDIYPAAPNQSPTPGQSGRMSTALNTAGVTLGANEIPYLLYRDSYYNYKNNSPVAYITTCPAGLGYRVCVQDYDDGELNHILIGVK